ncbi:hypothetical protein KUCAC02_000783 [Chaenocephalus aceratus]|uniref:Uncharacterized protein n=1 Tax=Chaenocephalus aceratus TaxID=36190 RepID=A0ACB9W6W5_CHAAC|nr:hypothetical protein KUCAC02_000783 [Chaenocephalus aceratus]
MSMSAEIGGGGSEAPLELRGSLDCWACSVLVTAQNLIIATINACLAGLVFGTILTPAIVMVVFGFLCHSTSAVCLLFSPGSAPMGKESPYCSDLLTDGGCVALLVVGFLLVTPLLVLALAAYCRPSPTPPAGPVLYPVQPGGVQEPAGQPAPGAWALAAVEAEMELMAVEGKGLGVR